MGSIFIGRIFEEAVRSSARSRKFSEKFIAFFMARPHSTDNFVENWESLFAYFLGRAQSTNYFVGKKFKKF